MRAWAAVASLLVLAACAATQSDGEPGPLDPGWRNEAMIAETRAYIEAANLETVAAIRVSGSLRLASGNSRFATLKTNRSTYLVETERDCPALKSRNVQSDMLDFRVKRNIIRAGYDTIRGCRIKTIYELPTRQVETTAPDDGQTRDR